NPALGPEVLGVTRKARDLCFTIGAFVPEDITQQPIPQPRPDVVVQARLECGRWTCRVSVPVGSFLFPGLPFSNYFFGRSTCKQSPPIPLGSRTLCDFFWETLFQKQSV